MIEVLILYIIVSTVAAVFGIICIRQGRELKELRSDALLRAYQFDAIESDIGEGRMNRLRSIGFDKWRQASWSGKQRR